MTLDIWFIYGLGVVITTVFNIFGHFLFNGSQDQAQGLWSTRHLMSLEKNKKRIYMYVVKGWDSQPFKIHLGSYCSRGPRQTNGFMTYTPFDAVWHKEQEFIWFKDEILSLFIDMLALSVRWGQDHPRDHNLPTIWCPLTQ